MRWQPAVNAIALLLFAMPIEAQSTPLRGTLHAIWDGNANLNGEAVQYFLVDEAGRSYELDLGSIPVSEVRRFERQRIELIATGRIVADVPVRITALRPGPIAPAMSAVVEARPFITLMCQFADDPQDPQMMAKLQRTLAPTYPGVAQYYGELAQDPQIMAGNEFAGWFMLPKLRSSYIEQEIVHFDALLEDCVEKADATVDFSRFYGINLQFSSGLNTVTSPYDTVSYGGSWSLTLDGSERVFGVTWISRGHADSYALYAHEMGHALGWPHSSGRYGNEYDSRWDVMSAISIRWDQSWGWMTVHTISPYKDRAGFIPAGRKWVPQTGGQTAEIVRSALPPATGYHMAEIPLKNGRSYTVETRMHAGHDQPLPAQAVVIHMVEHGRAYVVDIDNNGDPNDEGAIWRPGETFHDAANNVTISIEGATQNGFQVRIQRTALPVVIGSDSLRQFAVVGLPYTDTLRADGGVGDGMFTWSITSGALPAGLTLESSTGLIAGTPTTVGAFHFTARASSDNESAERSFQIPVYDRFRIASEAKRPLAVLGVPYTDTLRATGPGNHSWGIVNGRLPPKGMQFDPFTGVLTGTPAESGRFELRMIAAVGSLYDIKEFTYTVFDPDDIARLDIVEYLMTGKAPGADATEYMDLIGNRNGRLDIGDIRRWLVQRGELSASTADPATVTSTVKRTAIRNKGPLQ